MVTAQTCRDWGLFLFPECCLLFLDGIFKHRKWFLQEAKAGDGMGWDVLFALFSVGTRLELPGCPSAPLGSEISSVGAGVGQEELLWAQRFP